LDEFAFLPKNLLHLDKEPGQKYPPCTLVWWFRRFTAQVCRIEFRWCFVQFNSYSQTTRILCRKWDQRLMHCIVGIVHTCKFAAGKVQGHKFARTKLSILVREATVSWPAGYSEQGFDLRLLIVATLVQVIDLCGNCSNWLMQFAFLDKMFWTTLVQSLYDIRNTLKKAFVSQICWRCLKCSFWYCMLIMQISHGFCTYIQKCFKICRWNCRNMHKQNHKPRNFRRLNKQSKFTKAESQFQQLVSKLRGAERDMQ